MVKEFEITIEEDSTNQTCTPHHKQSTACQARFISHVQSLVSTMEELGNSFEGESTDPISLVSKDIADPAMKASLNNTESIGKGQYELFIKEKLTERFKPIDDSISRNNLPLWKPGSKSSTSKEKMKLKSVKTDCQLFRRPYIGCQSRDGDLDDFFSHENQGSPPSLSDCGRIRSGSKCDLIQCIDKLVGTEESHNTSVVVFDSAFCVQALTPQFCKTFMEYSEIFLPYIKQSIENVQRLDLVWDEYIPNSLKASTRQKRDTGARRRVLPSAMVAQNWQEFLCLDNNKKELLLFFSEQVVKMAIEGRQIIVTKGEEVLCSPPATGRNKLSLCSHEEAETRIMVHITDAVQDGHQSVMIRSTDTDVVVLTVAAVATLDRKELWVSYETGKNQKILPAHLSPSPPCLPIFHALTGCDTTSFFAGYGKRPAWAVWENFPNVTSTFLELAGTPSSISEENLCTIERFIILIYDRTSHLSKVGVNLLRFFLRTCDRVMFGFIYTYYLVFVSGQ